MSDTFKHLGEGQFVSAREYNRLVDAVDGLLDSTNVQYIADSRGVHVRRMPTGRHTGFALGRYTPANPPGPVTIPHNTPTTIPINLATSNPDGWLDTSTGIFTVPVDGIYFVSGGFIIDFGNLHDEHLWCQVNGGGDVISVPTVTRPVSGPGDIEFCAVQGMIKLVADQTVTFEAVHLAGGANTMEVTDGNGGHAGLWLVQRL